MPENTDTSVVKVSMKDIYMQVQKIQSMLEKLAAELPDSEAKIDDHEQRIRKLEMRMGWAVGVFGLLAAAMPLIVRLV
jgi:peptidoglycan hydrolase CwlO-like protein